MKNSRSNNFQIKGLPVLSNNDMQIPELPQNVQKAPRYATAIGMLYHLLSKDAEYKSATQQQPNKNFTAGYIKIALQAFIL